RHELVGLLRGALGVLEPCFFHRHHPTKLMSCAAALSNPKQQIAYLALKYWARLYCPAVVLGVYTPDEIEQRTEKEINPTPQRVSLADISGDTVTTTQSAQESSVNVDSLADDFRERIESAQDVDSAKSLRADIETAKATLGSALFTELKNKAV
ncbi:recombinase RecT, partial [Escherichia coli]|uniref:recombinase RecT n=1 Tax=Escherichia coli TaxID=562 RepID=UPI001FCE8926